MTSAADFFPYRTTLPALREAAAECRGCDLYRGATQTVFGEGPRGARIVMVGEQPGDREDLAGRPFVGPAGGLLDRAIEAAGLVSRRDLPHQRREALQTRRARQAQDPPQAGHGGGPGVHTVARCGAQADRSRGARAPRGDGGPSDPRADFPGDPTTRDVRRFTARAARDRDGASVLDPPLPRRRRTACGVRGLRRRPPHGDPRVEGPGELSPYHRRRRATPSRSNAGGSNMKTEPKLGSAELIELVDRHSAHNYHPLPVVVAEAEGAWVTDVEGKRYLDMLAAYSALNFGHRHPDLIRAAKDQLDRVTLTSRAFHHDLFGPFCEQLAELCGDGHGPRDELRRRSRRDRAQDRTSMGLRREGRTRGSREDRRVRRELPRPNDHDRRLLVRPVGDRWVRPVHPGFRVDPVRRRRSARHGARGPRRGRVPRRADPGRGGRP